VSVAAPPAVEAIDVILRDGSTLRLRAPAAEDADALLEFFAGLSEHSRYLRFHGFPALGPKLVEPVLEPDWQERGALLGSLDGRVVAVANWIRLRDPRAAEIAFAVGDEFQRRGVGTRLLERLAATAGEAGVEEFVAEVLHENDAMLRVFRDAGFEVTRAGEGGELEIRLAIAPTDAYREHVAERDHVAVRASLEPFFRPRSVAVIGASKRRGSIGGELFRNILTGDFSGSVYPVNKQADPVAGVHGYGAVGEIADAVDLAVVCLPGELVLDAAEEALAAGVRALVVISAGFAETGSEGTERQERLLALVRAHGTRLLGPNASASPRPRFASTPPSRRAASPPARSVSPPRAARSGSRCWSVRRRAASASPPSSRSATRPTSRRTTCSSGGRRTTRPSSWSSTSSRSATRGRSRASRARSRAASRSSP
jgi:ribosomal protein S18 acetylase RimI-like enzyme/predicted CoA-binding protein